MTTTRDKETRIENALIAEEQAAQVEEDRGIIADLQAELLSTQRLVETLQGETRMLRHNLSATEQGRQKLARELEQARAELDQVRTENQSLHRIVTAAQAEIKECEKRLALTVLDEEAIEELQSACAQVHAKIGERFPGEPWTASESTIRAYADEGLSYLIKDDGATMGRPDQKKAGLYRKYFVTRTDNKPIGPHGCIVLEVDDPRALPALRMWTETVRAAGYIQLASDMDVMLTDVNIDIWCPVEVIGPENLPHVMARILRATNKKTVCATLYTALSGLPDSWWA